MAPERGPRDPASPLAFGEVTIWPADYRVERSGQEVRLRPKEFELLVQLVLHPRRVMLRRDLLREVWGYHAAVSSRTLDTHIADLRRKLEPEPDHPRYIITMHRLGYRFDPDPA